MEGSGAGQRGVDKAAQGVMMICPPCHNRGSLSPPPPLHNTIDRPRGNPGFLPPWRSSIWYWGTQIESLHDNWVITRLTREIVQSSLLMPTRAGSSVEDYVVGGFSRHYSDYDHFNFTIAVFRLVPCLNIYITRHGNTEDYDSDDRGNLSKKTIRIV